MLETPPIAVLAMLAAGVANAVALTTISEALQYITVAKANATQIALSALAGLLLFAEPVTLLVLVGLGLTIAGLLSIGRQPARPNQAPTK